MSTILPYQGVWPRIADDAYIAPTAVIAGDVTIGSQASVWFGAVLRGDTAPITIGERTNIQDGCVLHADIGMPCVVGADCSVGHNAIIHGATIGDHVLIGMGATVLTGGVVEEGCILAACSLVAEGKHIPAGQLALGIPAKAVRSVTDGERERMQTGLDHYIAYSREYRTAEATDSAQTNH